jgi:ketosteroid isomerase-like protein
LSTVGRRSSELLERLRELEDRQALASLMNRYVAAVDAFDWEAWGACWAPDAIADFGRSGALEGRDAIVEAARARQDGYEGMQHLIANAEFDVTGDSAEGYGNLLFSAAKPRQAICGKYRWEFERTTDGWRITRAQLKRLWSL